MSPQPGDVVIGIATSGRTPFVIGALARAKERGATTVALVCNEAISNIAPYAEDADFRGKWRDIKQNNKRALVDYVRKYTGVEFDASSLFDVQVKRIHEYKRQLLNVLHVVHLYDRIDRVGPSWLSGRARNSQRPKYW